MPTLLDVARARQALRRRAGLRATSTCSVARRRVRRDPRRIGRRQVDAAELHRRARHASTPAACASTAPTSPRSTTTRSALLRRAAPRLRVPGLSRAAAPERRRTTSACRCCCCGRPDDARVQAHARRGRPATASGARLPQTLVGRPAAARRDRARAGAPAAADPGRRADRQPRPGHRRARDGRCSPRRCASDGAACVLVTHSRAAAARADRVLRARRAQRHRASGVHRAARAPSMRRAERLAAAPAARGPSCATTRGATRPRCSP